jgi:peptide/nickel transport system permease protein
MAVIATVVGVLIGAIAGITAAYFKGAVDNVIMRAVDVLLSFPQLVFALLLVSIAGSQLWLIVLAVAVSHAPQSARIVRGAALDVTERDFVKSAEVLGLSRLHIMLKEILPNLVSPLLVEAGLRFTFSIIIIAGLAFLGFGQPPPAANWGVMINENRAGISANPWSVIVPAALIAALTVGMNTLADAITRSATRGTVVEPIARSAKA